MNTLAKHTNTAYECRNVTSEFLFFENLCSALSDNSMENQIFVQLVP